MKIELKNKHIMNRFTIFMLIVMGFGTLHPTLVTAIVPVKHALIIAIGDYPEESGWAKLASANDVPLIKGTLEKQGFKNENISTLLDKNATKAGIIAAIGALTKRVKKGDIVVIHYSGHGHQISDDNKDEIDNLDEALVPYDVENVTGEKHIRDDQLGELLSVLMAKMGSEGHVIVFLDSCHSGTATRGSSKVRGGRPPLVTSTPEQISKAAADTKGSGLFESGAASRGSETPAHFVLFSAAGSEQSNFEATDDNGNSVGSLSYALSKAFSELDVNASYRELFAKVLTIMARKVPYQDPVIEGDIDFQVFNGGLVKQEPYFLITKIPDNYILEIDGGAIAGLSMGDIMGLYPSGTASARGVAPKDTGRVVFVDNFTAKVKFNRDHEVYSEASYWVFVKEKNYVNSSFRVSSSFAIQDEKLRAQLKDTLSGLGLVEIKESGGELLIEEITDEAGSVINIKAAGEDKILNEKPLKKDNPKDIAICINVIKNYAQSKFIQKLSMDDPDHRVEIELIPVSTKVVNYKTVINDTLNLLDFMVNGIVSLKIDDAVMIKVKNTGNQDAYFNIIDIQPNGIINAIAPDGSRFRESKELFIKKGEEYILPNFLVSIYYPTGTEMFKVFATETPIALDPIISSKGESFRGAGTNHPLELVVKKSYQTSRGGRPESLSSDASGSTFEYVFKICEK